MTKAEAADFLYDTGLERTGQKPTDSWRKSVIERLMAGDQSTLRSVCLMASPKDEDPTPGVVEAYDVLSQA